MHFESTFVDRLPGDRSNTNRSRQVLEACYSLVDPTPATSPRMVSYSAGLAKELGLSDSWMESEEATLVLSGNRTLDGMKPYAMCYGGHQFGHWAGQLGDGRAINLGEWIAPDGTRWTWQLKGAGRTPYSRFGDGLAVLRSSLREYACSEAMHALGISTTRALSLVQTGDLVTRDMFYDGNAKKEPGAVVCRVAPTFIRFGSFEIFAARQDQESLRRLANYTLETFYPNLGEPSTETYSQWFEEVAKRTARMIIDWMRVGFVHGVMNTDNMSILGATIDYGPYGWVDHFDPNWTPNTTDAEGRRYAFGSQPQIAQWNLVQLANAIYPLFDEVEPLQVGLDAYVEEMTAGYLRMQLEKLGLYDQQSPESRRCIELLERCWGLTEIDMTIFYRRLSEIPESWYRSDRLNAMEVREQFLKVVSDAFYRPEVWKEIPFEPFWNWVDLYRSLLREGTVQHAERIEKMNRTNPKYVLRNYLAQQAIDAAENSNTGELEQLLGVLSRPYDEQPEWEERYFAKRPEWARNRPGCSTLSCSS